MADLTRTNPRNANKKDILILIMMFPSINTDQTFCDFHREHSWQWENCELEHSSWNTVYMIMAFHTEYILKAALATSYGLLIRQ